SNGSVCVPYQPHGTILRLNRVNLCVGPAHHLEGTDLFSYEVSADLDTVAAEIDDCPAARNLTVPEPIAVGAWVGFAGASPENLSDRTLTGRLDKIGRAHV